MQKYLIAVRNGGIFQFETSTERDAFVKDIEAKKYAQFEWATTAKDLVENGAKVAPKKRRKRKKATD